MDTLEQRKEELGRKLGALAINLAECGEDSERYLAFTKSEPWFCFERASIPEIEEVVRETIVSYARRFYSLELETLNLITVPPAIPVEALRSIRGLRPKFGGTVRVATAPACA